MQQLHAPVAFYKVGKDPLFVMQAGVKTRDIHLGFDFPDLFDDLLRTDTLVPFYWYGQVLTNSKPSKSFGLPCRAP
ncbi:MAG TPA: hypothetical protein PKA31_01950 [Candidatus Moranbacteria bacterium]|nr:hypothetical protein [Candidatus Moranbacteria bacterium]